MPKEVMREAKPLRRRAERCMMKSDLEVHCGNSMETALVRVCNDLLLTIDRGLEAIVVLLDYSSAFNTINHKVALERLKHSYGIDDLALQLLSSYFEGWTQFVKVNDSFSRPSPLSSGVPQGSVMGPLEFILYTGPPGGIIRAHQDVHHAVYADDTQLYVILKQSEHTASLKQLSDCVNTHLRLKYSMSPHSSEQHNLLHTSLLSTTT